MKNYQEKESGLKVLIADDDPVVRAALGGMLENQGITVVFATDGNSAIYTAVTDSPDLIFLDLIMPQIDGFEVISQLRKMRKTRRIPVVLVTGRTDATTLVEAMKIGASDFICKPFIKSEVIRKLKFALMNKRQQHQVMEATLLQNSSQAPNGVSYERQRQNFILNFESIYLSMLRFIAEKDTEGMRQLITRFLDSLRFYELTLVREKTLHMLGAISSDDWDGAVDSLEFIYSLFQDLRRSAVVRA